MPLNICPNCSERLKDNRSKCPTCGYLPETHPGRSPVVIGLGIALVLLIVVSLGLLLL